MPDVNVNIDGLMALLDDYRRRHDAAINVLRNRSLEDDDARHEALEILDS